MTNIAERVINHDIRVVDGRYIQMPVWFRGEPDRAWGNLTLPNPHANSSVGDTVQKYPIGTKYVDGDRTFFYGYTNTVYTANKANIGMFNLNKDDGITWGATAGEAGDTKVGILASGLVDGTTPSEDDYAGGWLLPRTNPYSSYRIVKSSTSGKSTSGEVDIYIDHGLVEAVTLSQGSCFICKSEWGKMYQHWAGGLDYVTCVGVTLIDPVASTWQWVQAWGPCYVVPYNEEMGATVNIHQAIFHIDGTIAKHSNSTDRQLAGYLIPNRISATTSSWLVRLQVNC